MMVYLVRHGEAGQAAKDRDRKLTEHGKEQVSRIAGQIEGKSPKINKIFHSGLQRALETSMILKEKLSGDIPLEKTTGLLPDDFPNVWKEKLDNDYESEGIMLVGHNPFMTALSAHLMNNGEVVSFSPGNAACFKKNGNNWDLCWVCLP
tara:strand:- start:8 stop:454 length:447 start_codon:yes stop_codon:yes gene_type:complete